MAAVAAGTVRQIVITGNRLFYLDFFMNPISMYCCLPCLYTGCVGSPRINIIIRHRFSNFLTNIIPHLFIERKRHFHFFQRKRAWIASDSISILFYLGEGSQLSADNAILQYRCDSKMALLWIFPEQTCQSCEIDIIRFILILSVITGFDYWATVLDITVLQPGHTYISCAARNPQILHLHAAEYLNPWT